MKPLIGAKNRRSERALHPPGELPPYLACGHPRIYLPALARSDETVLNVDTNWEPSVLTTVMIATEMPAAIKPYSIAVAPD